MQTERNRLPAYHIDVLEKRVKKVWLQHELDRPAIAFRQAAQIISPKRPIFVQNYEIAALNKTEGTGELILTMQLWHEPPRELYALYANINGGWLMNETVKVLNNDIESVTGDELVIPNSALVFFFIHTKSKSIHPFSESEFEEVFMKSQCDRPKWYSRDEVIDFLMRDQNVLN